MEILVPEIVLDNLEGFMCEVGCIEFVQSRRNKRKIRLQNVVTTIYKTISYINIVFLDLLPIGYTLPFFTLNHKIG